MKTPKIQPTEPRTGWLFAVRYLTDGGTELTRWYRQGAAARRFADWLEAHGTHPRIYRTDVTRWQEDYPPETSRDNRRPRQSAPGASSGGGQCC